MKNKILVVAILLIAVSNIRAEKTLNFFKSNFTVLSLPSASIDSIKVSSDEMLLIYTTDHLLTTIPLSELDSVNFTGSPVSDYAVVNTKGITRIAYTSVNMGMEVKSTGGTSITELGICWNTRINPTTTNNKVSVEDGMDISDIELKGLAANTTYYARSYAKNTKGIVYGNQLSFTTKNDFPIVLTASAIYQRTTQKAICSGKIIFQGNSNIQERGFCWSTKGNPTINDSKQVDSGTTTGQYTFTLEGLNPDYDYYIRAYAINESGVSYGAPIRVIPVRGNVTYYFAGNANAEYMGETKFKMLTEAMDSACYYFNKYTGYVASIRVDHHEGVPTAEANYWGQLKFGANERYLFVGTAMHEMCHYFGSGTHWKWIEYQNSGFNMPATNALVSTLTNGCQTKLSAGGSHFWPFGCNQKEEVAEGACGLKNEEYLKTMAKLIWEMRLDCGWREY